jgi:hypothetical protein
MFKITLDATGIILKGCKMKKYAILLLTLFVLTTCESDDPIQFKLSTQVNPPEGGTISPSSGTFDKGEEITLKATPSDEYVFKNWSDDASGDENPMTAVMTDDMFVTANFEKRTYPLTIEIQGAGTVKEEIVPGKSITDYLPGTTVQLTAIPEEGWEFVKWENSTSFKEENPMVITIDGPTTWTAIFDPIVEEKVFVPDDNFEQALIDLGLDDVKDDYVLGDNISWVEELDLSDLGIEDLIGIEGFHSLKDLNCSDNNLHSLDLRGNTDLGSLKAENNEIELINFSQNSSLCFLELKGNNLSEIDLSKTESLILLDVSDNALESLDLSAVNLWTLYATGNKFTCVTVNETQLDIIAQFLSCITLDHCWVVDPEVEFTLDCSQTGSKIFVPDDNFEQALIDRGLDFVLDDYVYQASIESIEELRLENMQISDLTGIEGFKNLKILVVSNNLLQNIDVSQNSLLQQLICDRNQLTSLDISQNLELGALAATDNQLTCIQVSPYLLFWMNWVGGPAAPWFAIDEGVELSVDCSVSNTQRTYVPDDGLEQALIDLGIDQVLDDYVSTIEILNLLFLDISRRNISDLTGLEDFKGLHILNASNNDLTDVDISEWGTLMQIDLRSNPLTCIQMNEEQIMTYEGLGIPEILADNRVMISLDCGF